MSAFYVMIITSLFIAVAFLSAFIWSVRKGHYDDDYTPSIRILLDEPVSEKSTRKDK
ncbi:cbb3-type cytochrome oxidase assembly protein CcoS [Dyadobacter flavalbus]|uniref:Cbb3-type cytochrome oxidase assembly protein CcoS n=1 Tax=Dyadobacter flavalbus TaxID=2579942 RepID=A0A5M8QVH5_9BACT|nr:cbb3-type cytochrome oxidase assembly protein CcoS [Dyadobacter flavalbus]KAA6439321.1 cbb3-type cytochrome oxidase assembly protein CcoS [Dyadobacter flavalbus]